MPTSTTSLQIGIFGTDATLIQPSRRNSLPMPSYAAAVIAAGGTPVTVEEPTGSSWADILQALDGVMLLGHEPGGPQQAADAERLCAWCREHRLPLLGIDRGLHLLNTTFGGSMHLDLPRERPEALQHRHPLDDGLRHAINVAGETRLAWMYGKGELVVNSMHQAAVNRIARGFQVSARALDGVIEGIEAKTEDWFALGVQWQPASASASGLDIQLFRGFVEACGQRGRGLAQTVRIQAA